jgi:hypothetical protein
MRMPRFRFTVRRMMVVLAIVGTIFGAVLEVQRLRGLATSYATRSAFHSRLTALCVAEATTFRARLDRRVVMVGTGRMLRIENINDDVSLWRLSAPKGHPSWAGADPRTMAAHDLKEWEEEAKRHSWLSAKYARAARYPWLAVAPDPK